MRTKFSSCLPAAFIAAACMPLEAAEPAAELSVSYILETDLNVVTLAPGGQIAFPATSVDGSTVATVIIANRGQAAGVVSSVTVAGSFQPVRLPALPATVAAGQDLRFGLLFSPRHAGTYSGVLSLGLAAQTVSFRITGSTASPRFVFTYYFQTDGNVNTLDSGGRLVFPPTKINSATAAVVALANPGSGAGYVKSISLAGATFRLSGVALLPILVGPGKELRFGLTYNPTRLENSTGVLTMVLEDRTLVIELDATSTGPSFAYAMVKSGAGTTITPGMPLSLPDTALLETGSVTIRVGNSGNAEGTITAIRTTGTGYQLSNLPIMPVLLAPGAATQFDVTFTPPQPGLSQGRLQIGTDFFDLAANGIGPQLVYSYTSGAGPVTVQSNGTVLWGNVQVGESASAGFVIRNAGSGPATILGISIVEAKSAYRVVNAPALPAAIPPGSEVSFSLVFSPKAIGDNVTRLRIDGESFTLLGFGTAPPPLPAIQLTGPGAVEALQQPALGLTLASPYPLSLVGTLKLNVDSNSFGIDPAVQFATGGRSVAFTIPANSTTALFPGGTEIRLQTGTVAGALKVSLALSTGDGFDLTPDPPPALSLQVADTVPRVLDVRVDARSGSSFDVVVTGVSTGRSLSQLELEFTASARYNVPSGRFTFNIQPASDAWYRTSESQAYGSLFTATVPFTFQAPGGSVGLNQVIESVNAVLVNNKGRSNSLSVTPGS